MLPTNEVSSPPPTPRVPDAPPPDARDRLHRLAEHLLRTRDAHLLRAYLQLRATLR